MRCTVVPCSSQKGPSPWISVGCSTLRGGCAASCGRDAAALSAGGRLGADRAAVGGRLVAPAAEGEDEARDDCAGDEQCNGGRQQPAARVGAHPAPSGVVCAAARRAGARWVASSKPA